ncbi:hypothetical protein DCH27_25395 [Salmonella enterica]|nr:hypothetical protein [Salmonella enterica]
MSNVQNFVKIEGKAFNVEVAKIVTSLKGADRSLVDLVAAAGYRWFDKDRGGNDTIRNLVTNLDSFPAMQSKVVAVLKTFAPISFDSTPDQEGGNVYEVKTEVALKALSPEQIAEYKEIIAAFEKLELKRITDYGKREATTPTFKAVKLNKLRGTLADKAAALIATALLSDESESLEEVIKKFKNTIDEITAAQVEEAKAKILAKKPLPKVETPAQEPAPQPETV